MNITVKVFASLREDLGIDSANIRLSGEVTTLDVWKEITDKQPPSNLLCAINHQYVGFDETVRDGDEIAFFPPVNGG
ncbi:MAG: MoaD/ThiS family protein [Gammaproteobacteria bacterium]|nr:MoaD/ThiS family protein [Gammaproteobacteria bacterium]MCY4217794.1 MoaD/ThiS family protein [Gammaproteobacteria bacterium]MCY4274682.1 MoaD/ThiS family protein [Gammaproteobacteria bacterium]